MGNWVANSSTKGARADESALRIMEEVKRMILNSEILPGQQIRQEQLAAALQVSRQPIREALRQLVSEGLIVHQHNVGFSVARLSVEEFDQIYTLREMIETEIIRSLPAPSPAQLVEIRRLHKAIEKAAETMDLVEMKLRNRDFHHAIFQLSPLTLLQKELQRIWTLAMPYHDVYLHTQEGRRRVVAEHAEIVQAVADNDNERLITLMNTHRAGSSQQMNLLLDGQGTGRQPKTVRSAVSV
jgi:DNA-binding GntR family transcriptional regulator